MRQTIFLLFAIVASVTLTQAQKKGPMMKDDRDEKSYMTVNIGGQIWMAQNLNFETPNSTYYQGSQSNAQEYGRLYTWESAQMACPDGWHLPSIQEWQAISKEYGGYTDKKLMADVGNTQKGFNMLTREDGGFMAKPGGYRDDGDKFTNKGKYGMYWTSTSNEDDSSEAYRFRVNSQQRRLRTDVGPKGYWYSVRCVQNAKTD